MTENLPYWKRLQLIKQGLLPKEAVAKKKKPIPKQSVKKKIEIAEQKAAGGEDTMLEKWFKNRRKELVGVCQCGCAKPSQKKDDTFFRGSCCHIFPKAQFESVMYHKLNFVERVMFGGCHHNMDNGGLDKWPNMADWDDIKEKFHVLAPLLTDKERGTKFYRKLESLIYKN